MVPEGKPRMMFRTLRYTARLGALASGRARLRPRVAFLIVSSLPGNAAIAASCTALKSDTVMIADTIALHATGLAAPVVAAGIDYWRSCANYEEGFPQLIVGGAGTQTLEIRYLSSRGNAACGEFRGRTKLNRELVDALQRRSTRQFVREAS